MVDHSLMKTTILLLVSDPVVRSILKETLEREGYTVLASGDLGQAVNWLNQCTPDLLINPYLCRGFAGPRGSYVFAHEVPGNEGSNARGAS